MRPSNSTRALRSLRLLSSNTRRQISPKPYVRSRCSSAPYLRHYTTEPPPHSSSPNSNSTVDPTEVSHFNALASSWWDPHGPSRLLHLMNPLRHDFIARCHSTSSASASSSNRLRYLDIGCGGGIFAESAARLPHTSGVTGVDPTPEVLKVAEAHKRRDPALMQANKLTYINTPIEQLSTPTSPDEAYDVVSLFEVIEHINAPGPFLEHVLKHVKPGGWLVGSTIARTWTSWLVTNVVAEDLLGIVPRGTHEWGKYVNEGELRKWFAGKEGWSEFTSMGVVYVPGLGWREVKGGEEWGNYFFGVQKRI